MPTEVDMTGSVTKGWQHLSSVAQVFTWKCILVSYKIATAQVKMTEVPNVEWARILQARKE